MEWIGQCVTSSTSSRFTAWVDDVLVERLTLLELRISVESPVLRERFLILGSLSILTGRRLLNSVFTAMEVMKTKLEQI